MQQPKDIFKKMVEPLKTGELLVKEGFIRMDDIDMALSIQKKRRESMSMEKNRLLGIILCDLNLITPMDNFYVLHKYNKLVSIKSALVSGQLLSREAAEKTKALSNESRIPYISRLLKTGQVSATRMQKLLFDLFHIPFRSVRDFSFDEKVRDELIRVMDHGQSLENGVVPLLLKENTLLFGITEPINILLIRRLSEKFPQYRFKVVFIPWSGLLQFREIIYAKNKGAATVEKSSPDLSLLLKYRTSIKDPEKEKESILTLYNRYEQLHHLSGRPIKENYRENRREAFTRFIQESHQRITREYKSRSIEFSLKKESNGVKVIALPKRQDI